MEYYIFQVIPLNIVTTIYISVVCEIIVFPPLAFSRLWFQEPWTQI